MVEQPKKRSRRGGGRASRGTGAVRGSDEWRAAVREGMAEHSQRHREKNKARNETIVALYSDEGLSIVKVGARMGLNHQTVRKALHEAAAEGKVVIRPAAHQRHSVQ